MRSIARCILLLAGVVALNAWALDAQAKTIVVDFHAAKVFLNADRLSVIHPGNVGLRVSAPLREPRPLPAPASNMTASQAGLGPVQQTDFRAMLVLGAFLIAHQLRRKHRSLKQSLIAG